MAKKSRKKLTAGQKRAIAALKRYNRSRKSGGGGGGRKRRKSGKRRASLVATSGAIRAKSGGRKRRKSKGLVKKAIGLATPGMDTLILVTGLTTADVATDVATDSRGVRYLDPHAGVFITTGMAMGERGLVQGGLALEFSKLFSESFGTNKETGLPRRSLRQIVVTKLRELLGLEEKAGDTELGALGPGATETLEDDEPISAASTETE